MKRARVKFNFFEIPNHLTNISEYTEESLTPKQVVGQKGPIRRNREILYFFEQEPHLKSKRFETRDITVLT